jgi:hypothetical protein
MKKVQPGQQLKISAPTWNAFIDTANYVKKDMVALSSGLGKSFTKQAGIITAQNATGAAVTVFTPLVITGSPLVTISDPTTAFDPGYYFDADLLTSCSSEELYFSKIGIAQGPAPNDATALFSVMFSGITQVQIEVEAAYADCAYALAKEDGKLYCRPFGHAEILYRESGTGTKWAVIYLPADQRNTYDAGFNYYEIDRSGAADDALIWNPVADTPADWADYDGLKLTTESMRYRSGASATLEYIYQVYYWLTPFAPVVTAVTPVAAVTNICPNS